MYLPPHFENKDLSMCIAVMQQNAFATLISTIDGRPFATHLPLLISDDAKTIRGHFARANPHWQHLEGQTVLIAFQGPHDYVSPTWYEKSGGVPTWNYRAVHVYGRCRLIEDEQALRTIVEDLSQVYESQRSQPWDGAYPQSMLKAIIGFECEVIEIQGKDKLSQNRSALDRQNVADELATQGNIDLSDAMHKALENG